jgi:GNAT superfamily N-acetyltransferase
MEITYRENALTVEMFNMLKCSIGRSELPKQQVQMAIDKGFCTIIAEHDGDVVGMGRLVGDGAMYFYIQDMAIKPEYQREGIGRAIVIKLMNYIREHCSLESQVTVGLMAAKGKEGFYAKLGFITRPNEIYGPGMIAYICK